MMATFNSYQFDYHFSSTFCRKTEIMEANAMAVLANCLTPLLDYIPLINTLDNYLKHSYKWSSNIDYLEETLQLYLQLIQATSGIIAK